MNLPLELHLPRRNTVPGFTLTEVVIAMAMIGIVVAGFVRGYVLSARQAEWTAHSLAAESLALQGIEQARAAQWDPQAWPEVDELPPTNYMEVDTLDIPVSGQPQLATNFISITSVSLNPPVKQIRVDCVWRFNSRGLFTNTVVTLRAPDQ